MEARRRTGQQARTGAVATDTSDEVRTRSHGEARRAVGSGLTSNALKVTALAAMAFDHFCLGFIDLGLPWDALLRVPGRVAAPIMCYLIAEGFWHTSDLRRYAGRLLLFALVSHAPYDLYFRLPLWRWTSVMWSLLWGLLALCAVRRSGWPRLARAAVVAACCILSYPGDWNYVAVLWIVSFGALRGHRSRQLLMFCAIELALYVVPGLLELGASQLYRIGIVLALPFIARYNGAIGAGGRALKRGFYLFYPAHLVCLYLLRAVVQA